jgi:hypothetical protein
MQISEPKFAEFKNFQNNSGNSENSGQICTEWCETLPSFISLRRFGKGKQNKQRRGKKWKINI